MSKNSKNELRALCLKRRAALSSEQLMDISDSVFRRITQSRPFELSDTVLTYVSKPDEISTYRFIDYCFKNGKRVSVPKCIGTDNIIEFFEISSFSELKAGRFGVLEPTGEADKKTTLFENSICIVPGLCFDENGYRIGYGKGYYDRFLRSYSGVSVGVCCEALINNDFSHDDYDVHTSFVATENKMIKTRDKE